MSSQIATAIQEDGFVWDLRGNLTSFSVLLLEAILLTTQKHKAYIFNLLFLPRVLTMEVASNLHMPANDVVEIEEW